MREIIPGSLTALINAIAQCLLAAVLLLLSGCANSRGTVDSLKVLGYECPKIYFVTSTGERREQDAYDLWIKESRDTERRAHFCVVPRGGSAGYFWGISVFVDGREVFSYDRPKVRMEGISCIDTDPIPEGRMNFNVRYTRYN
jgi:hypothetical protein